MVISGISVGNVNGNSRGAKGNFSFLETLRTAFLFLVEGRGAT
jgi:hypothetical protein